MKKEKIFISLILGLLTPFSYSSIPLVEGITAAFNNSLVHSSKQVSDQFILKQRENLRKNTKNKDFGPQSPRDIDQNSGKNKYKLKENISESYKNGLTSNFDSLIFLITYFRFEFIFKFL